MKINKLLFFLLLFPFLSLSQVTTYPDRADFESGFGNWIQSTSDNFDWTRTTTKTPSSGTGPTIGPPYGGAGSTGYIFTESSGVNQNSQAWLECVYDMTTLSDALLTFDYQMYAANGGNYGPGTLQLDVYDGTNWTFGIWSNTLSDPGWQSATLDLSAYAGLSYVILSWTGATTGWQSDICLDNLVVDGTGGGGGGPPPCATLDYEQDFETGSTQMTATTQSQSQAGIDATSANTSLYGLHLQGNTSSSWYTPYTTGLEAFDSSPLHIATVSREICASSASAVTLTFDKLQTYTFRETYSWFRLTVNGTPISDVNGRIYHSAIQGIACGAWELMQYDLSPYATSDFTVAWEGCMKYYDGYTTTGCGGDNVFIDNIVIVESNTTPPPSTPSTIDGFALPNIGGSETYSVINVNTVDTYDWIAPSGWNITAGQGSSSIIVTVGSTTGDISVTATNIGGTSAASTLTTTPVASVTSYPDEADFETETQHSGTASTTGFIFDAPGWRNVGGDDGDWRADRGGTSSITTGPGDGTGSLQPDHNPGNDQGFYLFVESSTPNFPAKTFELWSPPYDLSGNARPVLTFWYNMYSSNTVPTNGRFTVQASTNNGTTWSNLTLKQGTSDTALIDQQGIGWYQAFIDLNYYTNQTTLQLKFKVVTGSSFDSDVCIDDVKLIDLTTTPLVIDGNINLTDNIFSSTGSDILVTGSSATTITSNGYTFNNITVNNNYGVTLNDNMTIGGSLGLVSGVISTGSNVLIITNTSASAIAGGSGSAFIYGNLRRHISANTGTYSFPIGQGAGPTNYYRADLINNNMNLPGGTDHIQMKVASITEGGDNIDLNINTSQGGTPISNFHEDAVWTMSPSMGGTFLSGSYGLNYYIANINGLMDNKFTILKRDGGSTTYADWETHDGITTIPAGGAAGRTVASGYAQKLGFTSFSEGGVGQGSDPLPIELVDFTAQLNDDNNVDITWTTASEINNDFFTVERSRDAMDFDIVVKIPGAGNSNQMLYYEETDNDPLTGLSYYRLKQTDYDGKFSYSNIVAVRNLETLNFSVMPNPTTDNLTVTFGKIEGNTIFVMTPEYKATIKIYNAEGKVIYKKNFDGTFYKFTVNVSDFPKGMYYVALKANKEIYKSNFLKH